MMDSKTFIALWQEYTTNGDSVLHILNQENHYSIPFPEIRKSAECVEELLPQLVHALPSTEPNIRWLILLEPNLPKDWLHLSWESLKFKGRPLSCHALVVRNASWSNPNLSINKPARFLDLFPQSEFSFTSRLQSLIQLGELRACRRSFLKEQMSDSGDLFIMAHGRESGLVDAENYIFDLPISHPMPNRIWLLACNVEREINNLALRLLNQGCHTVISATADISAPEMAFFVEALFANTQLLNDFLPFLLNADSVFNRDGNFKTLTIWGSVDIDPSSCSKWNRLTWDNVHGDCRRTDLDDETTREEFLSAYQQAMSPQAWTLTKKWMFPPLLWLAEHHHHPAMRELITEIGDTKSPAAIRSLAAAARRVGNYLQTAKYLSLGLCIPDLTNKERAEYLGGLANILIDLNLPKSAAIAIELHEDCYFESSKDREDADFRHLDWIARNEARQGRFHVALDLMTAKRKRAQSDTGRELAWQLYFSSWGGLTGQISLDTATTFAIEITKKLAFVDPHEIGFGNDTTAYLLRSLALYTWVKNDSNLTKYLEGWLQLAEARLSDDDPGPWAYIISFQYFQRATTKESFERAISSLERTRYYLEAASLTGFANNKSEFIRLSDRFYSRRNAICSELDSIPSILISNTSAESTERKILESKFGFIPLSAAQFGVLPL